MRCPLSFTPWTSVTWMAFTLSAKVLLENRYVVCVVQEGAHLRGGAEEAGQSEDERARGIHKKSRREERKAKKKKKKNKKEIGRGH